MNNFFIREIKPTDNAEIKNIILQVSAEYKTYDPNSSCGAGSGSGDIELDDLYAAYQELGARYWIVEDLISKKILGGGGYKNLKGENLAEMQKLFLLPEARGYGLAKQIVELILKHSKSDGYKQIYLETVVQMKEAIALYEKLGFRYLKKAIGSTGHFQCTVFMIRELDS